MGHQEWPAGEGSTRQTPRRGGTQESVLTARCHWEVAFSPHQPHASREVRVTPGLAKNSLRFTRTEELAGRRRPEQVSEPGFQAKCGSRNRLTRAVRRRLPPISVSSVTCQGSFLTPNPSLPVILPKANSIPRSSEGF